MKLNYKIVEIKNFKKELKDLLKKYPSIKSDLANLKEILKDDPMIGQSLGNGYYKVRMKISSKKTGKSGGARIITNVKVVENTVFLASIYDKSEMDTISKQQLSMLKKGFDKQ